jgi:ligand-binding SRPBCC domain-containing protein
MRRIELTTRIAAPRERCFDLSLSVDVHLESTVQTGERVVAGPTSGVLRLGDEITWEARHLGRRWRLSTRISAYDRPRMFRDELVRGPLRKLAHDHFFDPVGQDTEMRDVFVFESALGLVDSFVLTPHFRRLLLRRNETIKRLAESDDWRRVLPAG